MIELLVSLVVGAIAMACVGAFGFRQQRFHRDVVAVTERLEQLEEAAALIPIALRSVAPGEGDIPPGGARDTSIEFRATIATAVVCDSGRGAVILAPLRDDAPRLASTLSSPGIGDTLWALTTAGSSDAWSARAIIGIGDTTVVCRIGGHVPWADGSPRSSLVVRVGLPLPGGSGTPVRITRSWRYSLYKSSDGQWYLGAKDWNSSTLRFNAIQPVSGPFLAASRHGLAFQYFDSAGSVVPSGAASTLGIARIQIGFRADSALPGTYIHAIGVGAGVVTSVSLRNQLR